MQLIVSLQLLASLQLLEPCSLASLQLLASPQLLEPCSCWRHYSCWNPAVAGVAAVAGVPAVAGDPAAAGGPAVADVPVVAGRPCSCWWQMLYIAGVSSKPGVPAVCLHGPGPLSVCMRHRYQAIEYEHWTLLPDWYFFVLYKARGYTKKCRLYWLTNRRPSKWAQIRGERGSCRVSANEYSCTQEPK